ncbi:D-alanyl-D-alanine carboxypeptidase family protein [Novosphingopyxis baekryungensis]|uniref:D-alanyl-D-alanine carboxypeptidase family protein n=1 Tax=Novosphingopyxis baekryungensis TaxID=279369 RepID=UPI0003B36B94|nr:D-alanyl-D-alanine carboxypeptidase family protein [Novosphingopyxis baekryungensis]
MRSFLTLAAALSLAVPASAAAPSYDSAAPIAYMVDLSSGAELYARDADRRIPPASMAKMMTVLVAFDMIDSGKVSKDKKIRVREDTWREWNNRGSSMFLGVNEQVSVGQLLHGVVTLSGNDASVVLAQGLAGSEQAFVGMMNEKARAIGMKNSHFGNANGWPDEGVTYVTARDLATLAKATFEEHPALYNEFYGQHEFTWQGIKQPNRNPLIGKVQGSDGLKTGHTEEAGYGFTGSAEQNGRRLVEVIAGLDSYNGRIKEAVSFMEWGFGAWTTKPLFEKGAQVATAAVQQGGSRSVPLVAPRNLAVTLPATQGGDYKLSVQYEGPLKAPIAQGAKVAELIVTTADGSMQRMPLVAGEEVGEAGVFARIWNGFLSLFA